MPRPLSANRWFYSRSFHSPSIVARCLPNAHAFTFLGDVERAGVTLGRFKCEICGIEETTPRNEDDDE